MNAYKVSFYTCPTYAGVLAKAEFPNGVGRIYALPYRPTMPGVEHLFESMAEDMFDGNASYYAQSMGSKICDDCKIIAGFTSTK